MGIRLLKCKIKLECFTVFLLNISMSFWIVSLSLRVSPLPFRVSSEKWMRLLNTRQLLRMLIHRIRLVTPVHPAVYVEFSYQLRNCFKNEREPSRPDNWYLHVLDNIIVKCNTAAAWLELSKGVGKCWQYLISVYWFSTLKEYLLVNWAKLLRALSPLGGSI